MLASAAEYYRQQRSLAALGVRAALRARARGLPAVAASVGTYQASAALLAESGASTMLAEQGIPDEPVGRVNPASLITGSAVTQMVEAAETELAFSQLVATLVTDAGRTGMSVAIAARPNVAGHIRYLNPPSCSRCAILAGRFYRYSEGFQRHPRCDCQMVPTNEAPAAELIGNPMEAFKKGQIRNSRIDKKTGERIYTPGLTKADTEAIRAGADIGRVVNIRRSGAGLVRGSSVTVRAGRLTPEGVFQVASDRAEAIALLRRFGYVV